MPCSRPTPARASGNLPDTHSGDNKNANGSSLPQRRRRLLPRSSVYLSMRRLTTTDDIAGVVARALRREKDGMLEAPPGSTAVVFLDDVHLAEEVIY